MIHWFNYQWALHCAACLLLLSSISHASDHLSGAPVNFEDHLNDNQWLVVKVWRSDCGICMTSMPHLAAAQHDFPNANLLSVSLDGDINMARHSLKPFDLSFPTFVSDLNRFNAYLKGRINKQIIGYPTYLIFSPTGKLKAMQAGDVRIHEIQRYLSRQRSNKVHL